MADDTVNVKIVGDASGVAPGVNEAKGQIDGLATATKSASSAMKESFAGVSVSVREMGVQVRETFEAINGFREMLTGVGEAMIAAFAIEKVADWTKEMGEAAEKTTHLAETFGMSVGQVQQLGGVASATGISLDSVVRGMGILDKNMVNAAGSSSSVGKALKAVGIEAGDTRNQMQLMESVADKFKTMDDGPKKVALAMALFGKSGKELIPILNLGAEGLAEINRKSEEYGVVNEAATAKGMALAESVNESHLAMSGLANTMTDAFAPMLKAATDGMNSLIKAFIDSYKEGGYVKVVLETLSATIEILGTVFSGIGEIFSEVWGLITEVIYDIAKSWADVFGIKMGEGAATTEGALNRIKAVFVWLKDGIVEQILIIKLMLEGLVGFVSVCGTVIDEALTGQWGKIEASWSEGLANLARQTEATKNKIVANANEMVAALSSVWTGKALAGAGGGIPAPKGGGGGDLGFHGGGGGHQKKAEDHTFQNLEAELEKQKLAYAKLQDEQGTYQQFSLASEEKFWADALNRTDISEKARNEITKKWLAIRQSLLKEKQAAETEDAKQSAALATESAKLDSDLAKMALQDKIAAIDAARNAGKISATEEIREKANINQQLLDLEKAQATALYNIKLKELQDERAILGEKPAYYKNIDDQITQIEQKQADAEILLNRKKDQAKLTDDQKLAAQQRAIIDQWTQGFSQNISKMLTGQQSFVTSMKGIWESLQNMVAGAIEKMIQNWLTGEVTKTLATTTGVATRTAAETAGATTSIATSAMSALAQVAHHAAVAAAGAYAAIASIPFVGPVLAPIAAAGALAGVMMLGKSIMSAEGGDYNVTPGLYQLHANEMVLPAWAAQPLRNMISSGSSAFTPQSVANDSSGGLGDLHVHVTAMDAHSVKRLFMDHKGPLAQAVKKYARDGGR